MTRPHLSLCGSPLYEQPRDMPSRLIEAETITCCLAECHKAHGVTMSQGQDNGNRLEAFGLRNAWKGIIDGGTETPQPPAVPQPMRPKTSSSMVMAGHKPEARKAGEKSLAIQCARPKQVSCLEHNGSCGQQLMWPLTKCSHAPRLIPPLDLIFPRVARRGNALFIELMSSASVAGFPIT